jgi:hypothetical protein
LVIIGIVTRLSLKLLCEFLTGIGPAFSASLSIARS